jgi:E3 ubiquitin-protein ligase SHPRH
MPLVFQVLGPLLRLRQACSHPQAVRGQFLSATKATMSMEELLESLIKKTQNESEEALRQYIAALNGKVMVFFSLFLQLIFYHHLHCFG